MSKGSSVREAKDNWLRKIKAAIRLLRSEGYILCTVDKGKSKHPFYDHNVCEEDVIRYNGYLDSIYLGNQDALRQAKEILNDL